MVATGHNLDDEAAVLFGNVLRWDRLPGPPAPVLPGGHGFARKVKPLVRLGEREMAAYCVLRGIDYIVEECPMAAGNRHLGYKDALNAIEVTSPGPRRAFYFGFLDRVAALFRPHAEEERAGLHPCPCCGAPDGQRAVRLLQAGGASRRRPEPSRGPDDRPWRRGRVSRPLEAGERVLLIDTKERRYLVRWPRAASSTPTPGSCRTTT